MPLEKKYDATPLQVLTSKQQRARIVRAKSLTGNSQAQIMRDILDFGLPLYEEMHGIGIDDGLGEQ